jgi:chemotaxis response regulator CheB
VIVGLVSEAAGDRRPLRRMLEELGHLVLFDIGPGQAVRAADWAHLELLIEIDAGGEGVALPLDCFRLRVEADFVARSRTGFELCKQQLRRRIATARRQLGELGCAARAERVWLLAASAGGPGTVARFLAAVPPVPGVALLYAQHIHTRHLPQLRRWLDRDSGWRVGIAAAGDYLLEGSLSIAHPERLLRLHAERAVRVLPAPWPGPYRPSIDQLAESLALAYRERAGMIVFSGLGDDGVLGSQHLREQGGEVWIQDPAGCVASAMPEAVIARGAADYVGDLAALIRRFNRIHHCAPQATEAS